MTVAAAAARPPTAVVAAGALTVGALVATATTDDGPVLCPYRRCTGGWCPGCGGTRAARRLLAGDAAGAWHQHPWVVLAVAQVVVLAGLAAALAAAGRHHRLIALGRRWWLPLLVANAVALVLVWAVRAQAGAIPTWW